MPNTKPKIPARTGVLILAAGTGSRFGGDKMLAPLGQVPVISWSLKTFLDLEPGALIVVGSGDLERYSFLDEREYMVVAGGAETRRQSVIKGMKALPSFITHVLIHDGARPGVSRDVILSVSQALETALAALPVIPLSDTIRMTQENTTCTLDRTKLSAAQTPQGFERSALTRALKDENLWQTDEIQCVEAMGVNATHVPGHVSNMKITQAEDLAMVSAMIAPAPVFVTGSGFDVHRFCTPEESMERTLVLGGLRMPGETPLAGHSDADVLLHALCDAIYGALGDGDIGKHFPPSDMSWKNQDSVLFLEHALAAIRAKNGELIHADLTLICETPKLRPVEMKMKQKLQELLMLPPHRVGLKATTTEQLGFTGRKEGIAAQVTVTLRLPA